MSPPRPVSLDHDGASSDEPKPVYTTYSQDDVAVEATPDGGFIVAWESLWEDGDEAGVFAQRYDAAGSAVGTNFQVNIDFSPDQEDPAIAVSPAGDFVVAYENFEFDGSYGAITARRFVEGAASGVTGFKLKAGVDGKTQVQVRGKGVGLGLPLGPYSLPLTAQLIADDGVDANCWQTLFMAATKNTLTSLKTKGP
jgi:hypothetical protein